METIEELYDRRVRSRSRAERLRLVELAARDLAEEEGAEPAPAHSIMELHGLGAEVWRGVDAQQYVDALRDEWDAPR